MKRTHFPVKVDGQFIIYESEEQAEFFTNAMIQAGIITPDGTGEEFESFYELRDNNTCYFMDETDCEKCELYGESCGGKSNYRYYWTKPKGA